MEASSDRKTATNGSQHCDILITNGFVITIDDQRRIYSPGAIAISGSRIVSVGPMQEIQPTYKAKRIFDAGGAVVHPGLYRSAPPHRPWDMSGHLLDRALVESQPVSFADWKADVTPEDENIATQLASIELLRRGFTCFVEPGSVFDSDAVAEGVRLCRHTRAARRTLSLGPGRDHGAYAWSGE